MSHLLISRRAKLIGREQTVCSRPFALGTMKLRFQRTLRGGPIMFNDQNKEQFKYHDDKAGFGFWLRLYAAVALMLVVLIGKLIDYVRSP